MARNLDAKCRQCRREGEKLFLKGEKCFTDKCAIERRNYPPGQHGQKNTRLSGYGVQLREKQKVRRIYGLLERQFRKTYQEAVAQQGQLPAKRCCRCWKAAGQCRLSHGLRRFALRSAPDRAPQRHSGERQARQYSVIPVRPGDVVEVAQGAKEQLRIKGAAEAAESRGFPEWLEVDAKALKGTFKARPQRSELPSTINESLMVELYSK